MSDIRTHGNCSQTFKTLTCKCLKEETPLRNGFTVQPQLVHLPSPSKSCSRLNSSARAADLLLVAREMKRCPEMCTPLLDREIIRAFWTNKGRRWEADGDGIDPPELPVAEAPTGGFSSTRFRSCNCSSTTWASPEAEASSILNCCSGWSWQIAKPIDDKHVTPLHLMMRKTPYEQMILDYLRLRKAMHEECIKKKVAPWL